MPIRLAVAYANSWSDFVGNKVSPGEKQYTMSDVKKSGGSVGFLLVPYLLSSRIGGMMPLKLKSLSKRIYGSFQWPETSTMEFKGAIILSQIRILFIRLKKEASLKITGFPAQPRIPENSGLPKRIPITQTIHICSDHLFDIDSWRSMSIQDFPLQAFSLETNIDPETYIQSEWEHRAVRT